MRRLHEINKIDRNILRVLQRDARMTFAELARRVGLSTTPCKQRVKNSSAMALFVGIRPS